MKSAVLIVGGGLAGCECALTLARYGIYVTLYEQKPHNYSSAHISENLGELVCSNSFRSDKADGPKSSGVGILKQEMRVLGSSLMQCAEEFRVPAGKALAVDRELFSKKLTELIEENPFIKLERREIKSLEEVENLRKEQDAKFIVIASGPLTSESLAQSLSSAVGSDYCYFYDAIAPIVMADSLDMSVIFRGSRYDNIAPPPYNDAVARSEELSAQWREKMRVETQALKMKEQAEFEIRLESEAHGATIEIIDEGTAKACETSESDVVSENGETVAIHEILSMPEIPQTTESIVEEAEGDYLNCPMHKFEYDRFYQALLDAEKVKTHNFEKEIHFEGCMPIEAMAERGERTLTFGPLKPVGFTDPRTGRRAYAILQLRAESANAYAYNLVGCQTKMTYAAQDSVLRLVPGLENVEFLRYGSVHRNTYVDAPVCLDENLAIRGHEHIMLAGQLTGVEGYVESAACGLWAGIRLASQLLEKNVDIPPNTTAMGALLAHLQNTKLKNFQPSNLNFGLMPELEEQTKKKNRKELMAERAHKDFHVWYADFWGSVN